VTAIAPAPTAQPVKPPVKRRAVKPRPIDRFTLAVNRATERAAASWSPDGALHLVLSQHFVYVGEDGVRRLAFEVRCGDKHAITSSVPVSMQPGDGLFPEDGNSVELLNRVLADPNSDLNAFIATFDRRGDRRVAA